MPEQSPTPARGDPTDEATGRLNAPLHTAKTLDVELLDQPTADPLFDCPPMTPMTPPLYSRGYVGG